VVYLANYCTWDAIRISSPSTWRLAPPWHHAKPHVFLESDHSLAMTSAQLRAIPAPNIGCGTDIACSAQEGPVGRIHGHTAISGMVAREIRRGLGSPGATSGGDLKPQAARPPNPFCAQTCLSSFSYTSVVPFPSSSTKPYVATEAIAIVATREPSTATARTALLKPK
jgi:hypothetical protein